MKKFFNTILVFVVLFATVNAFAGGRGCGGGGCRPAPCRPCPPRPCRPCPPPPPHHGHGRSLHSEDWACLGIAAATSIISAAVAPRPVVVAGGAVVAQPTVVAPAVPAPIVIDPRPAVAPAVAPAPVVGAVPAGTVVPITPGGYYYNSVPVAPHGVVNYDGHGRPYVTPIKPGPGTHYYRPPAYIR